MHQQLFQYPLDIALDARLNPQRGSGLVNGRGFVGIHVDVEADSEDDPIAALGQNAANLAAAH